MIQQQFPSRNFEKITQKLEPLFYELAGARFFITGGTGFFGSWLVSALDFLIKEVGIDLNILILSRNPGAFLSRFPELEKNSNIKFCVGDVLNFEFPEDKITHVIHMATPATWIRDVPLGDMQKLVREGARRVQDFCNLRGIENALLTSSGAVYGDLECSAGGFLEDQVRRDYMPKGLAIGYPMGKWEAEHLATRMKVARCFAFLGPGLPLGAHYAAGNFIGDALACREITIKSDGMAVRSYMHPQDLVVWLITILVRAKQGEVFNVGSSDGLSLRELAERIAGFSGVKVRVLGKLNSGHGLSRYVPCVEKAKIKLGLVSNVSLAQSIEDTLSWYSNV